MNDVLAMQVGKAPRDIQRNLLALAQHRQAVTVPHPAISVHLGP